MALCSVCKITIVTDDKLSIACYTCKIIYYNKCCNVPDSEVPQFKKKQWTCDISESSAMLEKQYSISIGYQGRISPSVHSISTRSQSMNLYIFTYRIPSIKNSFTIRTTSFWNSLHISIHTTTYNYI